MNAVYWKSATNLQKCSTLRECTSALYQITSPIVLLLSWVDLWVTKTVWNKTKLNAKAPVEILIPFVCWLRFCLWVGRPTLRITSRAKDLPSTTFRNCSWINLPRLSYRTLFSFSLSFSSPPFPFPMNVFRGFSGSNQGCLGWFV